MCIQTGDPHKICTRRLHSPVFTFLLTICLVLKGSQSPENHTLSELCPLGGPPPFRFSDPLPLSVPTCWLSPVFSPPTLSGLASFSTG